MINKTLELAARGLPVFPCGPDKAPLVAGGFHAATTDPEQIRQWWTMWPHALPGVPTGARSGLTVLDIDVAPARGINGFDTLKAKGLRIPPDALIHQTRRGGAHWIIRGDGLRNSAGTLGPGLDVRGEGGYVIWWPATGLPIEGSAIYPAPEWIGRADAKSPTTASAPQSPIPEGMRNATLTRIAGTLRALGLTAEQIVRVLAPINEERCNPPLDDGEIVQIAESVARYAPAPQPWEVFGDAAPLPPGAIAPGAAPTGPRYTLVLASNYAKRPPLPWLVKGILPAVGVAALFGPSGSGKTFLGYDLGEMIERGEDWFGYKVRSARVTFVVLEGAAGVPKRVRAYHMRHGTSATAPAIADAPFSLLDVRDVPELASAIRHAGRAGGVVFIDTLNAAAPGADENSSEAMGRILAGVRALQAELGGLVVLIHHPGKDASKGMRGHSSLFAALDAVIEVTREGGQRTWRVAKSKDGEDGKAHPFRLIPVSLGVDAEGDPITSCVVEPDNRPMLPRQSAKLTRTQRIAMQALRETAKTPKTIAGTVCMVAAEDEWRQRAYEQGISNAESADAKRKAFIRARDEIIDRGLVIGGNGNYRIAFIGNIAFSDRRTDTDNTGQMSGHAPLADRTDTDTPL